MAIIDKFVHIAKKFPTYSPTVLRKKWPANVDHVPQGAIVHIDPANPEYWKLGVGTSLNIPYILLRATDAHESVRETGAVGAHGYANRGGSTNIPAYCLADSTLIKTPYIVAAHGLEPGDLLTSPTSTADIGRPTAGTLGTHTIIGQVVANDDGDRIYGDTLLTFVSFVQFPQA